MSQTCGFITTYWDCTVGLWQTQHFLQITLSLAAYIFTWAVVATNHPCWRSYLVIIWMHNSYHHQWGLSGMEWHRKPQMWPNYLPNWHEHGSVHASDQVPSAAASQWNKAKILAAQGVSPLPPLEAGLSVWALLTGQVRAARSGGSDVVWPTCSLAHRMLLHGVGSKSPGARGSQDSAAARQWRQQHRAFRVLWNGALRSHCLQVKAIFKPLIPLCIWRLWKVDLKYSSSWL